MPTLTRREIMFGGAALALLPAVARAMTAYTPGIVAERLAAGDTVFLDFSATWCSTCRAQDRVITALRSENPAYDAAITFIRVDWDEYGRSAFTRGHNVPRRSTLILLRGEAELGRVVASTRVADIEALMDLGLPA